MMKDRALTKVSVYICWYWMLINKFTVAAVGVYKQVYLLQLDFYSILMSTLKKI